MTRRESARRHNYQRLLNNIYQSIKQKEFFLKKQPHINPFTDDTPRSLPKLLRKDFPLTQQALNSGNFCRDFLIKQSCDNKYEGKHQGKTKQSLLQRTAFRTVDEEQKQVSKDNMLLLGLNIQRMNYSTKGKVQFLEETTTVVNKIHLSTEFQEQKHVVYHRVTARNKARSTRMEGIPIREKSAAPQSKQRQYHNPVYQFRINSYRQLLFELNFTYGVYRNMERCQEGQFKNQHKYKAWVGLGNNGNLIKGLLKRRFWWSIQDDKNCNFVWTQLKCNEYFNKQTECKEVVKSSILNNKKIIKNNNLKKIMNEEQIVVYQKQSKRKNYQQKCQALKLRIQLSQNSRIHNHLINNFLLGNKKALFYNLKQYHQLTGGNLFKSIPLTFHIKKGMKDPQYKKFVAYYRKRASYIKRIEREQSKAVRMRNIWIVKPGQLTNRGNGITVIDEIYELDAIMRVEGKHENGQDRTFIVQLYIDRPMLYKKRKFDIRHYMLVSHLHGSFKAFWHTEGYIRTSSFDFDLENFQREVHLTNDAVQKLTPFYGRYQPANKLSYADFQRYLDVTYPKMKYNFQQQIIPRMKQIALDAVKSTFITISPERLQHNFEIFGLDFMIDSEFKPWLIEINTNPCLQLCCPLLSRIIPQMVDQSLRLTLDVIYPPPCHYSNTTKHLVPDASLENLKYELFFDEKIDGAFLIELYKKNKRNIMQQIGEISDDEVYQDEGKDIILDQLL